MTFVGNFISDVANAVSHATWLGLPAIRQERAQRPEGMNFSEYKSRHLAGTLPTVIEDRRPTQDELRVYMFPQWWGSTALGFGGMGGARSTEANTVVVICRRAHAAAVYFAGQHAYNIDLKSQEAHRRLREDLEKRSMPSRCDAKERYQAPNEPGLAAEEGATP